MDLYSVWFPGKGERRQRPSVVPGSMRAYKPADVDFVELRGAFYLRNRSHWVTGRGADGHEAFWDWLQNAEDDYQMADLPIVNDDDGLGYDGASTIPLP